MNRLKIFLLLFSLSLMATQVSWAQSIKPQSYSVAYWGEMISHPGLKIEVNYILKNWDKRKQDKAGNEIIKDKMIVLSPSLGLYYHKRYQTGITPAISFSYLSVRDSKKTFGAGMGLGYLRTWVPNTYKISESGDMEKVISSHNYAMNTIFLSWGRNLKQDGLIPSNIYVKPQFMLALPNFPNAVGYFMLEVGVKYQLN